MTRRPRALATVLLVAAGLLALASQARAADPGILYPPAAEASDTKRGSVLFYNLYTSDPQSGAADTRISLTNTSTTSAAFIRLVFVEGATGSAATSTICLTSTQTATFQTSELRPGVTGYLIAVATDGVNGCPVAFNHLTGRADIGLASGFQGSLQAVGVGAQYNGVTPGCDSNSVTATLSFNGLLGGYNRLPRALDLSHVPSRADTRTLLVLNRIGGSLSTGLATIGPITGALYDDAGTAFPYTFPGATPQLVTELSNAFPVTAPPFETAIPAGRTGWTRLFNDASDFAYLGAALYLRQTGPPAGPASRAPLNATNLPEFAGAVNLRAATLAAGATLVQFPVQPPSC